MSDDDRPPEIRIDRIPVGKGFGALLVIIVIIGAMLVELPELRAPVVAGLVGGLVMAGAMIWWRRRRG